MLWLWLVRAGRELDEQLVSGAARWAQDKVRKPPGAVGFFGGSFVVLAIPGGFSGVWQFWLSLPVGGSMFLLWGRVLPVEMVASVSDRALKWCSLEDDVREVKMVSSEFALWCWVRLRTFGASSRKEEKHKAPRKRKTARKKNPPPTPTPRSCCLRKRL